jgi:hypothetical protein
MELEETSKVKKNIPQPFHSSMQCFLMNKNTTQFPWLETPSLSTLVEGN